MTDLNVTRSMPSPSPQAAQIPDQNDNYWREILQHAAEGQYGGGLSIEHLIDRLEGAK
ncbi:hypothetical protein ROLI_020080 [Roseobacter fucihabitans]|uniref:Uncharacterized protein n=1 Tax=Roseobacter fucihabitans TaxID=1537242 RepID=A0ABZ2BVQ3_9RHOB|nr:hypothetical protein [Roseobacter litoralis]MBC6966576.1 hypothetical protein [Roseobacter litoralis]